MPKQKFVHLVNVPVFDYNDEGWFTVDATETAAICKGHDDAVRWIAENGWDRIHYIVDDLEWEYREDYPDRDDYGSEDEYRADCLAQLFSIERTEIIRYG